MRPASGAAAPTPRRSRAVDDTLPHGGRRLGRAARRARAPRGRGIATTRSKRSSSARESFSRYAASRCGRARALEPRVAASAARAQVHRRRRAGSGPGRARARRRARPTTTPSSSGWRSASSTERGNSGSSSRSSTPRCARLTSPGRGVGPPPTIAGAEAPWCGARNGGTATSGRLRMAAVPATEWMRVTSSASSRVSGGRIAGRRRASIVLPVPGGPASRRLCAPAAAISSARRARSWPRTSARSGRRRRDAAWIRDGRRRRDLVVAAEVGDGLGEVADAARARSRRARPPARTRRRRATRASPARARSLGDGERPGDRPDAPVEARARRRTRAPRAAPAGSARDAASTASAIGEVEARPLLAQRGRREVDRDRAFSGHSSERRDDAAPDAVLRLLARAVGEPDDRERRLLARAQMGLDLDAARLEADERVRDRAGEHASTLRARVVTGVRRLRADSVTVGPRGPTVERARAQPV